MKERYLVDQYRDPSGRTRWAVLAAHSRVWYFPKSYGLRAAQKLRKELSENESR